MAVPNHLYRPHIEHACRKYPPVPPNVLEAVVWTESNFDPMAKSASNALGLTQIIYKYHKRMVDEVATGLGYQPHENTLYVHEVSLQAGARLLAWLYTRDGSRSWTRAVRAYFTGSPDAPDDFVDGQGTSAEQHVAKFVAALKEVEAYRAGGTQPVASSIEIIQKHIPPTNRNYVSTLLNATGGLWVTVHENGNTRPNVNAASEARFSVEQHGGPDQVCYHLAVDHLGAYQMIPLNRIGHHAGDGCDSRSADTGCFASIAIETSVGDNNRHKDATRTNLVTLIAMIIRGDPAIDFGGTSPGRFSVERIAPHKRWSSYSKDCPKYMLADGFFPTIKGRVIGSLAGSVLPPPPAPSLLTYPAGMDRSIASSLFGSVRGTDGRTYAFNESGSISKFWLENGKKTHQFPKLTDVQIFNDSETAYRKYFFFAGGMVLWHTNDRKAAVLGADQAA